eukprot:2554972-Rhodomonas_salina.1
MYVPSSQFLVRTDTQTDRTDTEAHRCAALLRIAKVCVVHYYTDPRANAACRCSAPNQPPSSPLALARLLDPLAKESDLTPLPRGLARLRVSAFRRQMQAPRADFSAQFVPDF